ncbi:hypothetical protein HPP92_015958 [Vanilla planifolia]|uniref:Uncharacterized protein n=1 Tax=Vanilla planifolia TaxID=51239 RepID=A0A835UWA0_VANPL|nr:hypothetical protein HPP92_015958 [Vanilla planifolia]
MSSLYQVNLTPTPDSAERPSPSNQRLRRGPSVVCFFTLLRPSQPLCLVSSRYSRHCPPLQCHLPLMLVGLLVVRIAFANFDGWCWEFRIRSACFLGWSRRRGVFSEAASARFTFAFLGVVTHHHFRQHLLIIQPKLSRDDSSGYDGKMAEVMVNLRHIMQEAALRDQGRIGSDVKRSSEGVLGPANWKNLSKLKENLEVNSLSSEQYGQSMHLSAGSSNTLVESKLKKVKLKVGGVTTYHSCKIQWRILMIVILPEKGQGETWKDAVGPNSSRGKIAEGILSGRQRAQSLVLSSEPVRKSTRVPKRRVLDGEFDDGEEDDEQKYILRLKRLGGTADFEYRNEKRCGRGGWGLQLVKSAEPIAEKITVRRLSDDTDYVEEDEPVSDDAPEEKKRRSRRNYHLIHP